MNRFASEELDRWLKSPNRKPLVMRGARQVGKTWLVRDFAKRHGLELIELNLENYPQYADLFSDNRPREILKNIEAALAFKILPESACLFLDEIQAAPELFAKLRWFRMRRRKESRSPVMRCSTTSICCLLAGGL